MITSGRFQFLHRYLAGRYADTVVLTLQQIEDLLGFALPDAARSDPTWWTVAATPGGEPPFSDAWTLASRSAAPNLRAGIVVFERTS